MSEFPPQPPQDDQAMQASLMTANEAALQQDAVKTPIDPSTVVETTGFDSTAPTTDADVPASETTTVEAAQNEPSDRVHEAMGIGDARREHRHANRPSTVSFLGHSVLSATRSAVGLGGQGRDAAASLENVSVVSDTVTEQAAVAENPNFMPSISTQERQAYQQNFEDNLDRLRDRTAELHEENANHENLAQMRERFSQIRRDAQEGTPAGNAAFASTQEKATLRQRLGEFAKTHGAKLKEAGLKVADAAAEKIIKAGQVIGQVAPALAQEAMQKAFRGYNWANVIAQRGDVRADAALSSAERAIVGTYRDLGAIASINASVFRMQVGNAARERVDSARESLSSARERANWRIHGVDMSTRPGPYTGKNRGVGRSSMDNARPMDLDAPLPDPNAPLAVRQAAFRARSDEARKKMAEKNLGRRDRLGRPIAPDAEATTEATTADPAPEAPTEVRSATKTEATDYDLSGLTSAEKVNELMNRIAADEALDLDSDRVSRLVSRMALAYGRTNNPSYTQSDPTFTANVAGLRQQIKDRRTARQTANAGERVAA